MKTYRTIEVNDNNYKVGDKISFTLNDGEKVEALAVKQEDDGMIFYFVDVLKQEYHMNSKNSNRGGYKACELKKKLNGEILDRFPAELREKMITFEDGDLLRLATEREIFGVNIWGEDEDESIEQWEPMKDRRVRIGFQGNKTGILEWCWLQNKRRNSAAYFCLVSGSGGANSTNASDAGGVRPAFKI